MKKWLTIILTALLIFSSSIPAFAVDVSNKAEISVNAKVEHNVEGEYPVALEDGGATIALDGDISITVTNAPKGAVRLIITPISTSEMAAWSWITACFKDKGTPIHAFDIHFTDESGNHINANGAVVTVDCPHCSSKPTACSLTTDGTVNELSNNARSVSVTFTTDGSHYYVMAEKASAPVDDDHKVDVKDPTGGKVDISDKTPSTGDTVTITPKPDTGKVVDKITVTDKDGNKIEVKDNGNGSYSYEQLDGDVTVDVTFKDKGTDDKPQTGDNSHLGLWITVAVISAAGIGVLIFFYFKRKKQN